MPTKGARGTGLRKYFQKQFATIQSHKRHMKQQLTVDYPSNDVYADTYKSLQTFQRMYLSAECRFRAEFQINLSALFRFYAQAFIF